MPTTSRDQAHIEESAGGVLLFGSLAVLIRVRARGFEIPRGHIEPGESPEIAALREVREETGLLWPAEVLKSLGALQCEFEQEGRTIRTRVQLLRRVRYFAMLATEPPQFALRPPRTRELRWADAEEAAQIELVSEELRPLLSAAFAPFSR